MNDIIERMRSGKRISETDSDFPRLCEEIENTRRLVGELNTGYHSPDEVRALLERIYSRWMPPCVCSRRSIRLSEKQPVWAKRCSSTSAARSSTKAESHSKTVYSSDRERKF